MSVIFLPLESYIADVTYESKGGYVLKIGKYYAVYINGRIEYVTDNETLAILLLYEKFLDKPRKTMHKILRLPLLRLTRDSPIYNSGEMLIKGRLDSDNLEILSWKDLQDYSFDIITYEWEHNALRSEGNNVRTFVLNFDKCEYKAQNQGTQIYECYIEDFGRYLVLNHIISSVVAQSLDILLKLGEYALEIDSETLEGLKSFYDDKKVYNLV
ncbi:hypothetical protein [Acidianus manzaensis]|uniref:Uncharacterized protein n=1 Tax=Acidianus manzaensis TaxID=282676 RepID=A0A1W6JWS6_9CREN|nr:hypothetical protein [Acidianus manzaensis]ARM74674.1 hypothetical protein B6F84_00620 [Acidianus manzaensis]